jgi:hypothetical protein
VTPAGVAAEHHPDAVHGELADVELERVRVHVVVRAEREPLVQGGHRGQEAQAEPAPPDEHLHARAEESGHL